MDGTDLFGSPPPARSITNKVTPPPDRDDAADSLTWRQRREMDRIERLYLGNVPQADPVELAFRHAEWWTDRLRVTSAMHSAGMPASRIERFTSCGGGCCVEVNRDTRKPRVRAFFCGDRFCVPCARGRAARVKKNLAEWIREGRCYHMVLTLRHQNEGVIKMLERLTDHFAELRRLKCWRDRVKGGCWTTEIKRGSRSGKWHVHLHGCVRMKRSWGHVFRREWKRLTGGSFHCRFILIRDPEKGAAYVAKYVTKGWSNEVLRRPADLLECIVGLRGRRLFATFGKDRPAVAEHHPDDPANWKPVARLKVVIESAERGEEWAVGLLRGLRRGRCADDGPTFHFAPEPTSIIEHLDEPVDRGP